MMISDNELEPNDRTVRFWEQAALKWRVFFENSSNLRRSGLAQFCVESCVRFRLVVKTHQIERSSPCEVLSSKGTVLKPG